MSAIAQAGADYDAAVRDATQRYRGDIPTNRVPNQLFMGYATNYYILPKKSDLITPKPFFLQGTVLDALAPKPFSLQSTRPNNTVLCP
jgi:hypothetical protein